MKRIVLVFVLLIFASIDIQAQINFSLNQLFRPGLRLKYQYLPEVKLADSINLGIQQANLTLIIPLGGGIEADFKDLKFQAKQSFLNLNVGQRRLEMSQWAKVEQVNNFALGFTHLSGKIGEGVWVYTVNVGGISTEGDWKKANYFALGGLAKVQIKGLRKQNIYGIGLGFNARRPFIFPVLGWNRKLAKDWDIAILLPSQVEITYRINKKIDLDWQNYFSAFAFNLPKDKFINTSLSNDYLVRHVDLRSGLELNWKLNSHWRILVESGAVIYRNLRTSQEDLSETHTYTGFGTWYGSMGIRYNFGKKGIESHFLGTDF
jgi:hypothetical protein